MMDGSFHRRKKMSEYIHKKNAVDAVAFGITIASAFNIETGERIDLFAKENDELRKAIKRIHELPSADVVQVIHAYWIDTENYYRRWRCSACSGHTKEAHPPFCPFCGAKMDGGKE